MCNIKIYEITKYEFHKCLLSIYQSEFSMKLYNMRLQNGTLLQSMRLNGIYEKYICAQCDKMLKYNNQKINKP